MQLSGMGDGHYEIGLSEHEGSGTVIGADLGVGASSIPNSNGLANLGRAATPQTNLSHLSRHVPDADKLLPAYKEIKNLCLINENQLYKTALEEWQNRESKLDHRHARRENRSIDLHNQIYNILGWFAVFQGVVLTAVSQLTQTSKTVPLCGKIWFPIVLTGFGSFATIVGISRLFYNLKNLERTIHTEKQARREAARRASALLREGPEKFNFRKDANNDLLNSEPDFWKDKIFVILSLVIFTGLFILSYFVILCDTWVVRDWDGGLHR